MAFARNLAIVALIALVFVLVPGGGPALEVILTLLTIGFFAGIAVFGYRMYREHHFKLDALSERGRLVLYSSVGLAFLVFAASSRLFAIGGGGVLIWIALLGLASYGVFWVYTTASRYE